MIILYYVTYLHYNIIYLSPLSYHSASPFNSRPSPRSLAPAIADATDSTTSIVIWRIAPPPPCKVVRFKFKIYILNGPFDSRAKCRQILPVTLLTFYIILRRAQSVALMRRTGSVYYRGICNGYGASFFNADIGVENTLSRFPNCVFY